MIAALLLRNAAPRSRYGAKLNGALAILCALFTGACATPAASGHAAEGQPALAASAGFTGPAIRTSSTATVAVIPPAETSSVADADEGPAEDEDVELEPREASLSHPAQSGNRYTSDLSDDELKARWKSAPESLGSMSIGFADEGRLINAQKFPAGDGVTWTVISPENTWGTTESIDYLLAAVRRVKTLHPDAPPLRVNQMSAKDGGFLPPHSSHQSGRDVDLGFYYPTSDPGRTRARERIMSLPLNWELLKSLVLLTDVQVILLDRRVQKVLFDYARKIGEDQSWLDSLFHAGRASLVQHARRHRDHFHVRFFNPRAQELGRRVAPLLADRPDQNMAMVRVKKGDTLGAIARRYRSSVTMIEKANHMRNSFLSVGRTLKVPMRGPCTQCPIPPALEVPPRRVPESALAGAQATPAATSSSARAPIPPR